MSAMRIGADTQGDFLRWQVRPTSTHRPSGKFRGWSGLLDDCGSGKASLGNWHRVLPHLFASVDLSYTLTGRQAIGCESVRIGLFYALIDTHYRGL